MHDEPNSMPVSDVVSMTDSSDTDLSTAASKDRPGLQQEEFNFTATRNLHDDGAPQLKRSSLAYMPAQRNVKNSEQALTRSAPPQRNLKNSEPALSRSAPPQRNLLETKKRPTITFWRPFGKSLSEPEDPKKHTQDDYEEYHNNSDNETFRFQYPILTMSRSEKKRRCQTRGADLGEMIRTKQKLHLLLQGSELSFRIFRWVSAIAFFANPLILTSGILPVTLLWILFGDIIGFTLDQGRQKLAPERVPKKISQTLRQSVQETAEGEQGRKKLIYAAGLANFALEQT